MTFLITGAAGVLGRCLARKLREQGHEVIACGRRADEGIDVIWDVTRDAAPHLDRPPDVVVHAAARIGGYGGPIEDAPALFETNVTGTARVVRWCALQGVRHFVFLSGALVYGDWADCPAEDCPVRPWLAGPYAVSKWCGEQTARLHASAGILRLSSLYGAGYRAGLIPRLLEQARATGEVSLRLPTDDAFGLLHVEDAARTIAQAAVMCVAGIWNIGAEAAVTLQTVGEVIARQTGSRLQVAPGPPAREARRLNWIDDRKARRELGHRNELSLEAGIALQYRRQFASATDPSPLHA